MVKKLTILILMALPLAAADGAWTALFNGKDLTGWKANENVTTFSVKDGAIVAHGPAATVSTWATFTTTRSKISS